MRIARTFHAGVCVCVCVWHKLHSASSTLVWSYCTFALPPRLCGNYAWHVHTFHAGLRVWHKLDRAFSTPRVVMYLRLSSPVLGTSPKAVALTHLMIRYVSEGSNNADACCTFSCALC